MKRLPKQLRTYITVLTVIAMGLLAWSGFNLWLDRELVQGDAVTAVAFCILALILELLSVSMPGQGYVAVSIAAYFGIFIKFDFSLAVAVAGVGLILKQLIINRDRFFSRLADFSTNIIAICSSGVVYSVLNADSDFLSLNNIIALTAASLLYLAIDYFLRYTTSSLLDAEEQNSFITAWKSYFLAQVAFIPLTVIIILTYDLNPYLALLNLIPLLALIRSIRFGMKDIVYAEQEKLVKAISTLQDNLKGVKGNNEELDKKFHQKEEELNILEEMGEQLGASTNLNNTLEIVVMMVRKLIPYQSCVIFLIEKNEQNENNLVAAKSITPHKDQLQYRDLLKLEESDISMVVMKKKPMIVADMQSRGEQRIFKDERSMICVPLIEKNNIIGVIYVGSPKPGTYNEDHTRLLTILGNAASNAIRTAQLYEQAEEQLDDQKRLSAHLENQNQNFQKLLDIGQKLSSSLNEEEAQKTVIDGLEEMFKYQTAVLFMVEQTSQGLMLVPVKFRSPYENYLENYYWPLDDISNILGHIAYYRQPVILNDTSNTKLQLVIDDERSVIVAPMVVENEVTGVVYVGHPRPDYFYDDDLRLLEAVVNNAAMALKNAEAFEEQRMQAITDGLTGLYTHRYFQQRLGEEINTARRRKQGFALVMIDADHFKTYNDTLGHPEGDMVLRTIADLMRKFTRDSDLICRIGGDEFTVLLKEIDKENALVKAEAIRAAVESTFRDHQVQITTSIGLACFPEDAQTKKDLVAAADAALYKSKRAGRNQVSVATGPVSEDFVKEPLARD